MTSHFGRWLRDPLFLLCLTAGLLAFAVQSGELGTADTMHRLQTTHWLWTSGPQVFPSEYPEFLEIYQMETLGHPTFVITLRFKNIVAFALGKMDAWGLNTEAISQDPWDYVHITTWNLLPFLLSRIGVAPGWVVNSALAILLVGVAALGWVLLRLRGGLRTVA